MLIQPCVNVSMSLNFTTNNKNRKVLRTPGL